MYVNINLLDGLMALRQELMVDRLNVGEKHGFNLHLGVPFQPLVLSHLMVKNPLNSNDVTLIHRASF